MRIMVESSEILVVAASDITGDVPVCECVFYSKNFHTGVKVEPH